MPRGYFQIRRSGGGLGPHIKFGSKIWGKVRPREEKFAKFCHHKTQKFGKVPILGSYLKFRGQNLGYLSVIFLEAKFGAPTRISEANLGAKPPRPPNMEIPPGPLCPPPPTTDGSKKAHINRVKSDNFQFFHYLLNRIFNKIYNRL